MIDAQLQERKLAGEIENYDKTLAELRDQRDKAMTDEPELNKLSQQLRAAEKATPCTRTILNRRVSITNWTTARSATSR